MLPVNDLGSDSPLYFSLLEHHCDNALKRINRTAVTSALFFRTRSHWPQKNDRPCVSVETGTCTNPSTERSSARCSPLVSQSPREWIQVLKSVRQFQRLPDRQLANRSAHRHANLRGNTELDSRWLAASLLPSCVFVEGPHVVHIGPSVDDNHSSLSGFQMRNGTEGVHAGVCQFLAWLFVDSRASQIK